MTLEALALEIEWTKTRDEPDGKSSEVLKTARPDNF